MSTTAEPTASTSDALLGYQNAEKIATQHLAQFDDLDFNVFSNQDWVRLHETHSDDVLVHWPDGHDAKGLEGTFTKPMPTADGKTIPPTGKAFRLSMCTVGHWKGGVMDEEYLFWDNLAFMKQIGVA
jgi:hypothetical protein